MGDTSVGQNKNENSQVLKKYRQHIINFVKGNKNNIKAQKQNGKPTGYLYLNKL